MINRLLQRQIMKHFGNLDEIPEKYDSIIKVISESYDHYEKDRKMLERSIDLSSKEMIELNENLHKEKDEQKKAADALNEIFNNIDQVVFSVDMITFRITRMSHATQKIYGYNNEDFISNPNLWQEVIYPEDRHISFSQIEELKRGEKVLNQYRINHADGSIRWIENKVIPILDPSGLLIRIDGVTSDITERKDTEDKVRRSEANLQTILDNADTIYVLIDTEMRIISFNQPARKFIQKELGHTVKEGTLSLDYFPESRKQAVKDSLLNTLKGEVISYEVKYPQPDCSEQWYYARYFPVINNGKVLGIILALTDITERKIIEKETQLLVESLQFKNKDLRQFAYIVSHDLRAPITKILGLASLLDSDPEDTELNKTLAENITTEANNLDIVVKDINTIIAARDSVDKTLEHVNFEDELKLITNVLEALINKNKAVISSDFCPKEIFTVKSYLYSIMLNLVSNAVKYCANDKPVKIHVSSGEDEKFIYLSVEDNGMGIDLKKHGEKVFGLYKRFHIGKIPGTGIGLNIVKSQVESLGGKIEVKSEVNHGSTFTVSLPKQTK